MQHGTKVVSSSTDETRGQAVTTANTAIGGENHEPTDSMGQATTSDLGRFANLAFRASPIVCVT
jgi:hypothetical protein